MPLPHETHCTVAIPASSICENALSEVPAKYTVPLVGVSSAASRCNSVLFPVPEGPRMAIISPCWAEKSISLRGAISCAPEQKVFRSPSTRSMGLDLEAALKSASLASTPVFAFACIARYSYHSLDADRRFDMSLFSSTSDRSFTLVLSNSFLTYPRYFPKRRPLFATIWLTLLHSIFILPRTRPWNESISVGNHGSHVFSLAKKASAPRTLADSVTRPQINDIPFSRAQPGDSWRRTPGHQRHRTWPSCLTDCDKYCRSPNCFVEQSRHQR